MLARPLGGQTKKNGPAPGPRPKSVDGHFIFFDTWTPKKNESIEKNKMDSPPPHPGQIGGWGRGYPHLFFLATSLIMEAQIPQKFVCERFVQAPTR